MTETLAGANFRVSSFGEGDPYAILVVEDGAIPPEHKLTRGLPTGVPVYIVKFADTGISGEKDATQLVYDQVFSAITPPLSFIDNLTRRMILEDVQIRAGECAPLLLEDVCEHVTQVLLSGSRKNARLSGDKRIAYGEFLVRLRELMGLPKGKKSRVISLPSLALDTIPSRGVEAAIERIASFYQSLVPAKEKGMPKISSSELKSTTSRKHKFRRVLLALSLGAGLVSGVGVFWYRLAARELSSQMQTLAYSSSLNPNQSLNSAKTAIAQLGFLTQIGEALFAWTRPGSEGDLRSSLPLLSEVIEGAGYVEAAKTELAVAFKAFVTGKTGAIDSLKSADSKLDNAYKSFSQVQARLLQQEVVFPEIVGGKATHNQLNTALPEVRRSILKLRSISQAASLLLEGKHNLAFLLLDHTEPRGAGGTVAAVAILSFDSGKLLTHQVYPVSVVDQMLTGQVVPPDEVRAYLAQTSWSLVDASWEWPFSRAAERMSWFLGKQLDRPIDGVMTFPVSGLPKILEVLGPIKLESGVELSGDNFNSQLEETISRLKTDPQALQTWESKVLSLVLEKVITLEGEDLRKTAGVMLTQLENSEANILVSEPQVQRIFSALSWDGAILTPACPPEFVSSVCQISTLLETENSLNRNKVNAFVSRSQVHTIKIGKDVLLHNRILTLTNKSSLLAWPYGSYQSLLKFMISEEAKVQNISVNDQVLSPGQFSLLKQDGKLVVRLGVEVIPGATVRVKLLYTEPGIPRENSSLVFFEQKQPTTASHEPFNLVLTYPDEYVPKRVAPRADVGKNSLTFTSTREKNMLFAVGF